MKRGEFGVPLRGVHLGPRCKDGTEYGKTERGAEVGAHAHLPEKGKHDPFVGWICAQSPAVLQVLLTHELAHLAANSGHDDRWRSKVRRLGGRVEATYQKHPKKRT